MSSRRRYEVLATIGEGGMGTVYRARLKGAGDFEKDVALKVLSEREGEDAEDIAQRLRDEARILGLIRHRAVVAVDGLVRLAGRWTVVMEFVDGVDLDEIFVHSGPMPVGCALEVTSEVAAALHVAWHTPGPDGRELKLLHRDLKPANIRVTPAGEVKVLDFGVAKGDFDAREAETRNVSFGSLGYVPQERIDGTDLPAGDVYSLGVVLYESLSAERWGQTHLSRKRHDERLDQRLGQLIERGVPRSVCDLVRGMMSFEPEERPTARDVERRASQLRAEVGGQSLRDWAEERMPKLIATVRLKLPQEGLTGEILEEGADSVPSPPAREAVPPPPPAPPVARPSRLRWVAAGVAVVLVVGLVIGGIVAAGLGGVLLGRLL